MTFTVDIEIARTVGSTPSRNTLYVFAHFMFVPHIVYKNKYSVSKHENQKEYYTKLSFFGKQDALPVVYTVEVSSVITVQGPFCVYKRRGDENS